MKSTLQTIQQAERALGIPPLSKTPRIGRPPLPSGERADSQIQLRVTRRRKAVYVRAAVKKGQTLAAWCFELLDRESGYTN